MKIRLHLKIFIFIAIFICTKQIEIYGILMIFAFFHEIGHMLTGIVMGFKPRTLEIMPFGLSIGFEGKVDNYRRKIGKTSILTLKKMIIALNGPLTNLIFIMIFLLLKKDVFNIKWETIIYTNSLIGMFNLIPIYPLDGGRILKYILQIFFGKGKADKYVDIISYLVVILITAISSVSILYIRNIAVLIILGYLWYLVIREHRKYNNKRKIYVKLKEIENSQT